MHSRRCYLIVAALISCPPLVHGAPAGTLDPTFGVGGKQSIQPGQLAEFYASRPSTVRDSAGRIYLVAGKIQDGGAEPSLLVITRLHHDGAVDTSYGDGGTVSVSGLAFTNVSAAAMQRDGRLVVGFASATGTGIKTCRLLKDGSLDPSFGPPASGGCTNAGPEESSVESILLRTDGRIVIVGTSSAGGSRRGVVATFDANGSLDAMFGEDGVALIGPTNSPQFFAAALAPNGDIVAAGGIKVLNYDFLVAKFDGITGKPVLGFGTGGFVRVPFDLDTAHKTDVAISVAVSTDGSIAAAGYAYAFDANEPGNVTRRPAVVKMTSSGSADGTFGPGGKRTYNPCPDIETACDASFTSVVALLGKRLVLVGWMSSPYGGSDFFAMRALANGTADPDFGPNPSVPGRAVIPFDVFPDTPSYDEALGITMDGDRILLNGWAARYPGTTNYRKDIALARLDHGLTTKFAITPKPGAGGAVLPATAQQIGHSDRAEFVVVPEPGFELHKIEKGPGYCDGGMDGEVFVSAPVTQSCEVHLSFQRRDVFADGFE